MDVPALIQFTVPGNPRPTNRPRVTSRNTFTDKASLDAQSKVATYLRLNHPQVRVDKDGTWALQVRFYRATRVHTDLDNLAKTVLDGLQGYLFLDDHQVDVLNLSKHLDRTTPRTVITAWRTDNPEGAPIP